MAYKNYTNTFYSEKNNRWDIEIWSQSDTSTGNIFTTGKGGFKLSYKGSDSRRDITMPSEMTMQFIIKDADDQTFITELFEADDNEYFVLIRRNFVVFWWGNLNAGFDSLENDYYPYEVTLKANDFLGEVINRKDYVDIPDNPIITIGELTGTQIIDITKLASTGFLVDAFPLGSQEKIIRLNNRWTAPNQVSYNNDYNPFSINRINVAAFEASSNEAGKYYPANAFKEILKSYGLKAFQSEGKINIIQPYSYIDNTINVKKVFYNQSASILGLDFEDIDNRQNAENDTSVASTIDSGFRGTEWLYNPLDFTDSNVSSTGSVTSITSNSFNIALTSSFLSLVLTEGVYNISYSQNDTSLKIVNYTIADGEVDLLTESGEAKIIVPNGAVSQLRFKSTTTGTKTIEYIGIQKGELSNRRFLGGQRWRFQRPISKVTANFNYGENIAQATSNWVNPSSPIIAESQYTSLSNIGAFSTAAADQMIMNMNVFYGEKFDYLSAADNFTHIGGTLTLKLKLGSLYLSGDTAGDLSWSGSDSTFTIPVPIGYIDNGALGNFILQTLGDDAQAFYPNDNAEPFFSGTGSRSLIGVSHSVLLPSASSGGSVDLQFVSAVVNYYTDPDLSDPSSPPTPLTVVKNNLTTKWFTGTGISGGINHFNISFTEAGTVSGGIQFSASTGLDNYQTEEFGTLSLGISGDENSFINCIQIVDNSFATVVPDYLQVNNTGTQYNMTSLLLEEYLEPQIEPLKILEGSYYVNDFSAFKCIVIDGEKYVFFEGTLTADSDTIAGNWYKLSTSTETITIDDYDEPFPEPDPTDPVTPPPNPPHPNDPTGDQSVEKAMFNAHLYNSIGVSSTAINLVQTDKVYLLNNPRCSLYDDQKLVLTRPDLTQPIILTKDGASTTSSGYIEVDAFTPDVIYPIGSILSILTYDLTNVITGGGTSTPNLYQGITTTEIYLSPDKFDITNVRTFAMYSSDSLGSVQQSTYSRGNKAYAATFIPIGYKVTSLIVYSNVNNNIRVYRAAVNNDSTLPLVSGTANSTITFSTPYTSVLGQYLSIEFEFRSLTDEIEGAKLTIQAV